MPKGVDNVKPMTPGWYKRQDIHRHNGFFGTVSWASQGMRSICDSVTATPEAKSIAHRIWNDLGLLRQALKTRNPGT